MHNFQNLIDVTYNYVFKERFKTPDSLKLIQKSHKNVLKKLKILRKENRYLNPNLGHSKSWQVRSDWKL